MPWIPTIQLDEATGTLLSAYQAEIRRDGFVPNIIRALSGDERTLTSLIALRDSIYSAESDLKPRQREFIHTWVSALNGCGHSVRSHAQKLRSMGADHLADELLGNGAQAVFDPEDEKIAVFCRKATLEMGLLERNDVDALKAAGLSDRDVLNVVLLVAYRNFMNVVACALGVEDEPQTTPTRDLATDL